MSTAPTATNRRTTMSLRQAAPVLGLLVKREFRTRYAGSVLGVLWNLVHPVVMIAIFIVVFSPIMKGRAGAGGTTLDYAVHLTSGMIPWLFFSDVVNRGTGTLVENAAFLKRLALPPEILHAGVLINAFVVNVFSLAALTVLLLAAGANPGADVLLALPLMILFGLFATGLAMFLSVLHLILRDMGQLVNIALQFLFWLTPVVYYYSADILPPAVMEALKYNPILPFVSLTQELFGSAGHAWSGGAPAALLFVLPLAALALGSYFLRRHRTEILDEL